jgi:fructose-1,6-bisphosphatase II
MQSTPLPAAPAITAFGIDSPLVLRAVGATRAAALAAARWSGRGDPQAADRAATDAMRAVLARIPGTGTVVTGEGAKDGAPMLADGERVGAGDDGTSGGGAGGAGVSCDIAVDPLECTDLCARGLPGALATIALAPAGSLFAPGPAYYMDKLVLPAATRGAARLSDPPELIVERLAQTLGRPTGQLKVVVLDKPRHGELVGRLRRVGVAVTTPTAGDVAGALSVLLPEGGADLLLGIGGTPEGVMTACAVRALGGGMQGRLAPQRDDERARVQAAGLSSSEVLELEDLAAADGAFIATGVTGGELLAAPRFSGREVTTESLVIAAGAVLRIRHSTTAEPTTTGE